MFPFNKTALLLTSVITLALAGCGGGSSSGSNTNDDDSGINTENRLAGAVKGPLAVVSWTLTFPDNILSDDGGPTTDFMFDLPIQVEDVFSGPALLEIDAAAATDLTTNTTPTITTLRTIISREIFESGEPIFVTPLSTLATNLLLERARPGVDLTQPLATAFGVGNELVQAEINVIDSAMSDGAGGIAQELSAQVMAVFGFGAPQSINVFTQRPVYFGDDESSTQDSAALTRIVAFRKANEALGLALTSAVGTIGSGTSNSLLAQAAVEFQNGDIDDNDSGNGANIAVLVTAMEAIDDTTAFAGGTLADVQNIIGTEVGTTGGTTDTDQQLDTGTAAILNSPSPQLQNLFGLPGGGVTVPTNPIFDLDDPDNGNADGDAHLDINDPFIFDPTDTGAIGSGGEGTDVNGNGVIDIFDRGFGAAFDADNDQVFDGVDNCTAATGSTFGTNSNTDQADADGDGVGDACDANPNNAAAFDDADLDGVLTSADNCPSTPNADQANNDGDALGDVCDPDDDNDGVDDTVDDAPFNDQVATDPDGDDVDANGAPFNGPDNCPNTANTNQFNLDLALANGVAADIEAAAGVDNATALDWIANEATYAVGGSYIGDAVGDACEDTDGDNDVDGDGRIAGTAQESDDGNPEPGAVNPATDLDGDQVVDTDPDGAGGIEVVIRDNCPGVPNPATEADPDDPTPLTPSLPLVQANFDAAEEAAALGITVRELIDTAVGVGDACDSDNDNDGLANNFFVAQPDPTMPFLNTSGVDPDEFTPASLDVFADQLTLGVETSPAGATTNVRFEVSADSISDTVAASGSDIDTANNNSLGFSQGAGLAGSGTELAANGTAGDGVPLFEQNRLAQELRASVEFNAASCSAPPATDCSLAGTAGTATVVNGATDTATATVSETEFALAASEQGFNILAENNLLPASGGEIPYVRNQGGVARTFGDNWIAGHTTVVESYTEDGTCSTALGSATDDAQIQAALAGSCVRISDETNLGLRVFTQQDTTSAAPQTLAAASAYGVVEFDVTYTTTAASNLVTVTSNVNEGNGGDGSSAFTTTTGLTAGASSILYATANDTARSLTPDNSVFGQVTLGAMNGFTDASGSLLTLVDFAQQSGGSSDTVGRAYGVLLDTVATNATLVGSTYNLAGIYMQSDSASYAIGRLLGFPEVLQLDFAACTTDANQLEATLSSASPLVVAEYREDANRLPESATANLLPTLTSDCFNLTSGRFEAIDFAVAGSGTGTQLQLEGFNGVDGLLFRVVSAIATPDNGGSTVTEDFVLLSGFNDLNSNGVAEEGEVEASDIFLNFANETEVCTELGITGDCSTGLAAIDGSSIVYLDSSNVLRTVTYLSTIDIQGGGGGGGTVDFALLSGYNDIDSSGTPDAGEVEASDVFLDFTSEAEVCTELGISGDCSTGLAAIDGSSVAYIDSGNVLRTVTYVSSIEIAGGGGGASTFGFVQEATGNPGTPQTQTEVDAAGGESYLRYTVGQGVLFATPD